MIIGNQQDVTKAVLEELQRAPNARFKEVMSAFVRHAHAFAREVKLTEDEFRTAMNYIVELGKHSNEFHNEAVLMSGSLGLSTLVCLLNNGDDGHTDTDQNLLGPFWRMHSPVTQNGASIVRSPTPGPVMFAEAWFSDRTGNPIAGAEVDIWHSSPEGFYENQDPAQAEMNLRGKFFTDAEGRIAFRSVLPAGYPIPIGGPVGDLLRAQGRHNMRPAHLHFLASKDGFKTLISQIYVPDDPNLETDVQFGVTRHLIGKYIRHENEPAPEADVQGPWYSFEHRFVMQDGDSKLPRAPITGKAEGERPVLPVLVRTP
ncbi:MAG: catechol 1,2-dioxygenase [Xanthobacteraceae bacterium]|nr:catechol 1,2-dioxygenase [Xanthobacteraceae bacterium]